MANNTTGLNKNDVVAAGCTILALAVSMIGTVFGFKGSMQRAEQINNACGTAGKVEPLPINKE